MNCSRSDQKWLRAIRKRYIRKVCSAIACDRTHNTLNAIAKKMIALGLYASTWERGVRYSILREMHKLDRHQGLNWWTWYQRNGWIPYCWQRKQLTEASNAP